MQKALVRAWGEINALEDSTNLRVWLFKIFHQLFYSEPMGSMGAPSRPASVRLVITPSEEGRCYLENFRAKLSALPIEQRAALLLVAWEGFSQEEAAEICDCSSTLIRRRVEAASANLRMS